MKTSEQTISVKSIAVVLLFAFASVGLAKAEPVSGDVGAIVYPIGSTSSFGAGAFTLNSRNLITDESSGDFLLLANSDLTASTQHFTGLTSTPTAESVNDFFLFSSPDSLFGTSGTTPINRFDFELLSLAETSYTGSTASFVGTGEITDLGGTFAPTPAKFDLSFSSQRGYSLFIETEAVPEPSTYALVLAGVAMLAVWGRRRLKA